MNLDEARDEADAWDNIEHLDETDSGDRAVAAMLALADRLDEIELRAWQIRGGLKPYARPVEIVDYLLAEPEG